MKNVMVVLCGLVSSSALASPALYSFDGASNNPSDNTIIYQMSQRYQGGISRYFRGTTTLPAGEEAVQIAANAVKQVCSDVKNGITEFYFVGYSRGAMTAIKVAYDAEKSCNAPVVWIGAADAVNAMLRTKFPTEVPSHIPAIHIYKNESSLAAFLFTAPLTGSQLYNVMAPAGMTHEQIAHSNWVLQGLVDDARTNGLPY